MKKIIVLIIFFANILFWLGVGSCSLSNSSEYLPLPSTSLDMMNLFITADSMGSLEPCGCKSGQMGGLPRQAQYLMQNRKQGDWLVDLGNSMSNTADTYELFKWYYILLTYEKMGYSAINLGQNEIQLPATEIVNLQKRVTVPLVSANIVDSTGAPLVQPYVICSNGNVKIAITGVVQNKAKVGSGIVVTDILSALEKYLPQMIQESNLIVVLANLPNEQVTILAQRFPEIALVLNTGISGIQTPHKVGPVVISHLTEQGRFVQKIQFRFQKAGELASLEARNIRLGNDISDHIGTVHLLNRYRQDLAEKRFYIQGLRAGEEYAGADRCAMCHSAIHTTWKNTAHARSLESLKLKNNQHDPHCLKCHVTGFGFKTGFTGEDETPDKARIGCEVCHGPSAHHANHQDVQIPRPSPQNTHPRQVCLECHTWEHCGAFDFDTFWKKIEHSKNR